MIRKEKGVELMKILFITNLSTFVSKVFLTLTCEGVHKYFPKKMKVPTITLP